MFHVCVFKYQVVYYVIYILVINSVADISIDYYFGNDEPLRSIRDLESCKTEEKSNECRLKCGPEHACLLGQCFCVNVIDSSEENSGEERPLGRPGDEEIGIGSQSGGEEIDDDDEVEEKSSATTKSFSVDEQLVEKPALRHHIAHFCPNLDEARVCIRQCLEVAKPAFCGKDHKCYCGHRYDFPEKESMMTADTMTAADVQGQFDDLYEKYFGPKPSIVKLKQRRKPTNHSKNRSDDYESNM